jgi:hypothetical protein
MTAVGLVSRVSPVQTVLRNCTRDEGRSFEVGNQVLISSHRMLLSSVRWPITCAMQHGLLLWVLNRRTRREHFLSAALSITDDLLHRSELPGRDVADDFRAYRQPV